MSWFSSGESPQGEEPGSARSALMGGQAHTCPGDCGLEIPVLTSPLSPVFRKGQASATCSQMSNPANYRTFHQCANKVIKIPTINS